MDTASDRTRPYRPGWRVLLLAGPALAAFVPAPALAETLQQALRAAYEGNPTLTAQRASVRAADESIPLARAAGQPTVEGSVTYEENVLKGEVAPGGFFSNPDRQLVGSINASVPLLTFGAVRETVNAAEARVSASQASLRGTESELFSAVVAAYMDVIRDEAIVRLNERNHEVMAYTLRETRDRHAAGERPSSDVDQADAREALAASELESARAKLITSRESYIQLVGHAPGRLEAPQALPPLPASPAAAVAAALENNPAVLTARSERAAAGYDVRAAGAEGMPRVNAIGSLNSYDYLGSLEAGTGPRNRDQGTTASVGLQLKVPFVQGGRVPALQRQAYERQGVAIEKVTEAERLAVAETRSAYATWRSSGAIVGTAQRGVAANTRALESIRAQTDAGVRPLIDRLNAEQELLNAQVTLVTARRDAYVAGFALLAAMGQAEAKALNLDGGPLYDPQTHLDQARAATRPFAPTGSEPGAVAQGTQATPDQTAELLTPMEPLVGP